MRMMMKSAELRFELNFLVQEGNRPETESVYLAADEINKHLEIINQSTEEYVGISFDTALDTYAVALGLHSNVEEEIKEITERLATLKEKKASHKKYLTESQLPKKVKSSLSVILEKGPDFVREIKFIDANKDNAPKLYSILGKLSRFVG
jgi:hypothetical protein